MAPPSPNPAQTTATPRSAAFATSGLASGEYPSTRGQQLYDGYYRNRFYARAMQSAAAGAAANPGIPRLEFMQAELARLEKLAEANRAELLKAEAAARKLAAAERAALRKTAGGGGFDKDLFLEVAKLRKEVYGEQRQEFKVRLDALDPKSKAALVNDFGTTGSLSSSMKSAATGVAKTIKAGNISAMTTGDIKAFLGETAGGALEAARVSGTSATERAKHASEGAAFAAALRQQGVSEQQAQAVTAELFNLTSAPEQAILTSQGTQAARDRLRSGTATDLLPTTVGGQGLQDLDAELRAVQMRTLGLDPTGAPLEAGEAQRRAQARLAGMDKAKLSPDEQRILDAYLMDLRDDGTPNGSAGGLSDEARAQGQAIYRKAKDGRLYNENDAALFDDQYLARLYDVAQARDAELAQREDVLARAERTPEEVERDAARSFINTVRAAEGLEQAVDPSLAKNYYEQRVLGGALDILQKEGDELYDSKGNPLDRDRRLGGTGPLARRPHRVAKRIYDQFQGEDFGKAQKTVRDSFRDPENRRLAETYLLAMYMRKQQGDQTGSVPGKAPTAQQDRSAAAAVERATTPADVDRAIGAASLETRGTGIGAGAGTAAPMSFNMGGAPAPGPAPAAPAAPTPQFDTQQFGEALALADQYENQGFMRNALAIRDDVRQKVNAAANAAGAAGNAEEQMRLQSFANSIEPMGGNTFPIVKREPPAQVNPPSTYPNDLLSSVAPRERPGVVESPGTYPSDVLGSVGLGDGPRLNPGLSPGYLTQKANTTGLPTQSVDASKLVGSNQQTGKVFPYETLYSLVAGPGNIYEYRPGDPDMLEEMALQRYLQQ